jgi:outer membrane protein
MKIAVLASSVALALSALSGHSHAQTYDLVQAYRDALANDAQLLSARSALEAAKERVPQAAAGLKPNVALTGSTGYQYFQNNPNTGTSFSKSFAPTTLGVNLTYPLFRLQNVEALEQSKIQQSVSEAQLAQTQVDLILRVAQAYFDVLAAQDSLGTVRAQKRAVAEQLASAKRNFEVGTATITDQQEAQAKFDLVVAQEFAGESDLEVKYSALSMLTGKPVNRTKVLRPGVALQAPQPARETEWVDSARANNYQVQQAVLGAEVARREINKQRYGEYPTIDVVGGITHSRNPVTLAAGGGGNTNTANVGLQLNVPLYTGGAINARVREAAANMEKSKADLEVARRQVEQATRVSYVGVNSGLAQVRALEAAERSSQLALDSNQLGYQVGVRINVDVLNAQQQLFTTRRDLSKARYDTILAGLKLKASAGSLKEEDIDMINGLLSEPVAVVVPAPAPSPGNSSGVATPVPAPAAQTTTSRPAATAPQAAPATDTRPAMRSPAASEQRGGRSRKPMAPKDR